MKKSRENITNWAKSNTAGIFIFNMIIIFLVLLRSAGYFHPFFVLTINLIVFVGILLSIFLLGAKSKTIFIVAILFWIFAALFKVIKIDIWSERMGIYTFESLVVAISLLLVENTKSTYKNQKKNV